MDGKWKIYFFLAAAMLSCKQRSTPKNADNAAAAASPTPGPEVTTAPQTTQNNPFPVRFKSDGTVNGDFELRLDIFVSSQPTARSVPSCAEYLDGETVLGKVTCTEGSTMSVDLKAKHARQRCGISEATRPLREKSETLKLSDCKNATITPVIFRPSVILQYVVSS